MQWNPKPERYPPHLRARIRRGRGMGEGATYLGWPGLREGPRKGTTNTPLGLITGRMHDLRDAARHDYFCLVERQSDVLDIQELFPILDLGKTQKLCAKFGIEHPNKNGFPEPFILDFLITRQRGDARVPEARSMEPVNMGGPHAEAMHLHVIKAWCDSESIDWKMVPRGDFTRDVAATLRFARAWTTHRYKPDAKALSNFVKAFLRSYKRHLTAREILEHCSARTGVAFDQCCDHFRYAVWTAVLRVDLTQPLVLNRQIALSDQP